MPYIRPFFRLPALLIVALPVVLIGVVRYRPDRQPSAGVGAAAQALPNVLSRPAHDSDSAGPVPARSSATSDDAMAAACRQRAAWAASQLGSACAVIVRAPFVLGGDLSPRQLDRCYQETIRPAADALKASYLTAAPQQPITLLLFASQSSYRQHVRGMFGEKEPPYFGSYRPHLRVLALDASTGGGTIVHELTHALIHGDFPAIPDWLNEGLASLHEEYRVASDGSRLEGLVNWRLPILQAAIRDERLRPLRSLIVSDDFHDAQERLNYAQARHLCLYLQRLGVLERYYRRLRADIGEDPTGLTTLLNLFPGGSVGQLDADFRRWAMQGEPFARGTSPPDSTREECGRLE